MGLKETNTATGSDNDKKKKKKLQKLSQGLSLHKKSVSRFPIWLDMTWAIKLQLGLMLII